MVCEKEVNQGWGENRSCVSGVLMASLSSTPIYGLDAHGEDSGLWCPFLNQGSSWNKLKVISLFPQETMLRKEVGMGIICSGSPGLATEQFNLICIWGWEFQELCSQEAPTIPPLFPPLSMCCFLW